MTHIKDLRGYVDALKAIGEMVEISREVDLNLEIGAISRRCYETGAPAALFTNIRGAGKGFRVLGAPAGVSRQSGLELSRIALSLGLDPHSSGREIVAALAEARSRPPIPPRVVATGPCKENIKLDGNIDLEQLPAPLLHEGDGGRYLNTYGIVCVQTPDKRWTNWSIARIMITGKCEMAGIVAPNQHIGMVRKEWLDIGQDMPFALALGPEPFLPFVGGMPLPENVNEADFAGAYFGEPIEVVACETVPLFAPATAEIIVEGYLSQKETSPEGPMGEYAGYLWGGGPTPKPRYRVTALTYRNNAILPISVAGEPPEENHTAWGIPNAAEIVYQLRKNGLPVATAWSPFASANHWFVIAAERDYAHKGWTSTRLCQEIGNVLFQTKAGMGTPKYLVVNDDIDLTNLNEVVWAFATRNHPGPAGETVFNNESTNPLVAFLSSDEKQSMHTTKTIYNCLPPDEWQGKLPKRSSFHGTYPLELQEKVLANWQAYGFQQ